MYINKLIRIIYIYKPSSLIESPKTLLNGFCVKAEIGNTNNKTTIFI